MGRHKQVQTNYEAVGEVVERSRPGRVELAARAQEHGTRADPGRAGREVGHDVRVALQETADDGGGTMPGVGADERRVRRSSHGAVQFVGEEPFLAVSKTITLLSGC